MTAPVDFGSSFGAGRSGAALGQLPNDDIMQNAHIYFGQIQLEGATPVFAHYGELRHALLASLHSGFKNH
jgi:hypothetical protein